MDEYYSYPEYYTQDEVYQIYEEIYNIDDMETIKALCWEEMSRIGDITSVSVDPREEDE